MTFMISSSDWIIPQARSSFVPWNESPVSGTHGGVRGDFARGCWRCQHQGPRCLGDWWSEAPPVPLVEPSLRGLLLPVAASTLSVFVTLPVAMQLCPF